MALNSNAYYSPLSSPLSLSLPSISVKLFPGLKSAELPCECLFMLIWSYLRFPSFQFPYFVYFRHAFMQQGPHHDLSLPLHHLSLPPVDLSSLQRVSVLLSQDLQVRVLVSQRSWCAVIINTSSASSTFDHITLSSHNSTTSTLLHCQVMTSLSVLTRGSYAIMHVKQTLFEASVLHLA